MEHIFEIIEDRETDREYEVVVDCPDCANVGYAMAVLANGIFDLKSINVYPAWRGQGLGTKIMERVIDWAKLQGACVLTGSFFPDPGMDEQLRAFYERLGIKVTPDLKLYKDFLRR